MKGITVDICVYSSMGAFWVFLKLLINIMNMINVFTLITLFTGTKPRSQETKYQHHWARVYIGAHMMEG